MSDDQVSASDLAMVDESQEDDDQPLQRLSPIRVTLALLVAAAVLTTAALSIRSAVQASAAPRAGTSWFAPYVDTTLTPLTQFQDPGANPARQLALGFLVADPNRSCQPSWGGAYSLAQAATSLNLDSRIAQVRAEGGNVLVSFGGQAHSELALTCPTVARLAAAYSHVISRYRLRVIDFDIEGSALDNAAATRRRAAALVRLQRAAQAAKRDLSIWLTVPVGLDGLDPGTQQMLRTTLAAGVRLAGVNVMAMDFGRPEADMAKAVETSLRAANGQLSAIDYHVGLAAGPKATWTRMGATVMIGQNDSAGEIFTVGDARRLLGFVRGHHVRRVSMWSLNRDIRCGTTFAAIGVHANNCSGTSQVPLEFSKTFAAVKGSMTQAVATQVLPSATRPNTADNPYPIWQPARPYAAGYKVVREGNIYQAKWYSQGQDPAAQVQYAYQTPWQLIGPVLPGDHAPTTTTLPPGTYPVWSPTATYVTGDRVLYQGLPYQAKWYNKGTSPGSEQTDPSASPWDPRFTIPGEPSGS